MSTEPHRQYDEDVARRVSIQASVSRRVDQRTRMLDPAFLECSHAEHVRRLVVLLGEIGALDPQDGWAPKAVEDSLQETLVDCAADIQAWMEHNARNAAEAS